MAFFKLNTGVIAATTLQEWQQEQHQEQRGLISSLCLSTGMSPASLPPYGHIHTGERNQSTNAMRSHCAELSTEPAPCPILGQPVQMLLISL